MLYFHAFFANNMAVVATHQVINLSNAASRRVFDRQQTIGNLAFFHCLGNVFKQGIIMFFNLGTREIFLQSKMTISSRNPLVTNNYFFTMRRSNSFWGKFALQILFLLAAAYINNLSHNFSQAISIGRILNTLFAVVQNDSFTRFISYRQFFFLLIFRNFMHGIHAFFEKLRYFGINFIDFFTYFC